MACHGLIVAGGAGRRFGDRKQFASLAGKPVIWHSLSAFEKCPGISEIVLVTNSDAIDRADHLVRKWHLHKVNWIVAGGKERQDSVYQGLRALPDKGIVAIHDGVRPALNSQDISRGLKACRKHGSVIYARPIDETIKEVRNSAVIRTVARQGLFLAQTPQFFPLELIRRAHQLAAQDGYYGTDDAELLERIGEAVNVLPGWQQNIKITTRADLDLAARIRKSPRPRIAP